MSRPAHLVCANCDFYAPLEAEAGLCRRYPPKRIALPADAVGPTYWCGEWSGWFYQPES